MQFSPRLRKRLANLEAGNFAEFSLCAYRIVKASEEALTRVKLPSPAEGLISERDNSSSEQVA